MRRALHLLLAFAVLWCGLHVMDPAEARSAAFHADHAAEISGDAGERDDRDHAPARHACHHHHCPVAPDLRAAAGAAPLPAFAQEAAGETPEAQRGWKRWRPVACA